MDQRTIPIPNDAGIMEGEHTHFMGNPADIKNRQWADHGSPGYHDSVNIAWPENEVEADIYMVPDFQGMSGQGANQTTLRPLGST